VEDETRYSVSEDIRLTMCQFAFALPPLLLLLLLVVAGVVVGLVVRVEPLLFLLEGMAEVMVEVWGDGDDRMGEPGEPEDDRKDTADVRSTESFRLRAKEGDVLAHFKQTSGTEASAGVVLAS